MARTDNLTNYLTDVSTSIKNKIGDNTPIQASQFDTKINNIEDINSIITYDNYLSNYRPSSSSAPFSSTSVGEQLLLCILLKKLPKMALDFTNINYLAYVCFCLFNLQEIDVSEWNVSTIKGCRGAFYGCRSLKEIDLSAWQISTGTSTSQGANNIAFMFKGCNSLKRADLSCFKGVWGIGQLFNGCTSLEHIDIRGFDLPNCSGMKESGGRVTFLGSASGSPAWEYGYVPYNCEIIVGTQADKDYMTANFASYTNVKTVAEYEAE